MRLLPLGDSALLLDFADELLSSEQLLFRVHSAGDALERAGIPGVLEVTSSYQSVALFLDLPALASAAMPNSMVCFLEQRVKSALSLFITERSVTPRLVEVPVCYAADLALDLDRVAKHTGLDVQQIIRLHTEPEYITACVGFLPGFPYLSGLAVDLNVPRLSTPRTRVPAGSVAIAGSQAGVYPLESPGGWNVIGRTPLQLFDSSATPPALLLAGDRVRFREISRDEFDQLKSSATAEGTATLASSQPK